MRCMQQIMARSPQLKILFERLGMHVRLASQIEVVLQPFGFQIYGIAGDAQLSPLAPGGLASFSGYALAARPEQVDTLDRRRFSIYPSQLLVPGHPQLRPGDLLFSDGTAPQILFHGPYWFLRRGVWVLHIHGTIDGEID